MSHDFSQYTYNRLTQQSTGTELYAFIKAAEAYCIAHDLGFGEMPWDTQTHDVVHDVCETYYIDQKLGFGEVDMTNALTDAQLMQWFQLHYN